MTRRFFFPILVLIGFGFITQIHAQGNLTPEKIKAALDEAYTKFKDVKDGKNADYIKELANVDPNIFGIAVVTTDGTVYTKGDVSSMVPPFVREALKHKISNGDHQPLPNALRD